MSASGQFLVILLRTNGIHAIGYAIWTGAVWIARTSAWAGVGTSKPGRALGRGLGVTSQPNCTSLGQPGSLILGTQYAHCPWREGITVQLTVGVSLVQARYRLRRPLMLVYYDSRPLLQKALHWLNWHHGRDSRLSGCDLVAIWLRYGLGLRIAWRSVACVGS